ncbi:secretion protein HylD [Sphingopyxis sp. Root214]|uniref:HlyD family type I secretion periplasmic adaptor subunit n=1 Tax=unclassified Sphingopyxis TaxID=2614943 RepID=UPI0006FA2C37|nr:MULTISPECIES: HlyD family type I secretion periplasmic adaptor subunit [unclassified Sphingopyxis]KQZ73885.1 secretion protein HylD [Sphingopyxis sp. Root154]KRC08025.1 secretion protein HylD [Sphingopyxis sp. Root214]
MSLAHHWGVIRKALRDDRERQRTVLRTTEHDFLPAALEVIERPVSPTARVTAWTMLGLLTVALLWLFLGRVDVVVSATGKLVPADDVQLIQPGSGGIVHTILVRNGQRVRAGQPLVELDPTVSDADTAQASKALETAMLDAARLRAILSALDGHGLGFTPPAGTTADVAATQIALARAQLAEIRAGSQTRAADTESARAARAEAEIQAAKLNETLPLLDEQIAANETLLEKGYVSKLRVIEMRRQRLVAGRDRDAALATARKAEAQIAVAGGNSSRSTAEARARVLADLAKAESDARLRAEELTKATKRGSLQRLVSPVDGTVTQLAVHTVGGVVEAAKPIMVIVPARGKLVAEVAIANKDVGFVGAGQPVALKIEAFPFTRYGTVPSRLEHISSDAVQDEKRGLIYTARVTLDRATIRRDGTTIPLTPGMAVTADVRTGRRSLASYLLSPIDKMRTTAARER